MYAIRGIVPLKFKLLAKNGAVSFQERTSVTFHPSFILILDLIGIDGSLAKMARCKAVSSHISRRRSVPSPSWHLVLRVLYDRHLT